MIGETILGSIVSSMVSHTISLFKWIVAGKLGLTRAKRKNALENPSFPPSKSQQRISDEQIACYKRTLRRVYKVRSACLSVCRSLHGHDQDTMILDGVISDLNREMGRDIALYPSAAWAPLQGLVDLASDVSSDAVRLWHLRCDRPKSDACARLEGKIARACDQIDLRHGEVTALMRQLMGTNDNTPDLTKATIERLPPWNP